MIVKKILPILMVLMVFFSISTKSVLADAATIQGSCGSDYVDTGLGCVPTTVDGFIKWFLPVLFGISGGISFLLMAYGFIMVAMSGGDEKKLQGAKETITSALTGLLVSVFALFILRLIAVDILKIPGTY